MQTNPSNPFNIEIAGNYFYIHETSPEEAESALTTLKKIEHLLRNHLSYDADLSNNSIPISRDEVYQVLRQKAKEIRNNYAEEQSQRNIFARFIFSEERSVNDTLTRIENMDAPIFPLLIKDLPPKVLEKMGIKDLSIISQVNRQGEQLGKKAIVDEIKKLGYEGTVRNGTVEYDYKEGIKYLEELKLEFNDLWILDFSPSFFIMEDMKDSEKFAIFLFQGEVKDQEHLERILNKLLNLSNETLITLCINPKFYDEGFKKIRKFLCLHFDLKTPLVDPKDSQHIQNKNKERQAHALCQAVALGDKDVLKLLLRLGVPPDSEYEGQTALEHAQGNEECVEILTEALKKPEEIQ